MKKKLLFLFLTFIFFCHLASAKKIITSTAAADDNSSPTAGVAVLVENSDVETVTDSSPPDDSSGGDQDTCSNLFTTASSGKVNANFTGTSYYRVEQLLQGQVPGLYVTQNSGAPGSDYSIFIRGVGSNFNASPVIFIDGIRTEAIEFLDPNDIESIKIQKDAAATAIYGIEGGNGVIWITTRKGSGGENKISYNFSYGTQSYSTDAEMMDNQQYYTYIREGLLGEVANANALPVTDPFVVSQVDSMFPYTAGNLPANTRWLDEIFESAPMQKHHISIAGGSETSDYYISGNYYLQEGVIGGSKSSYKRVAVRLNTNSQLNKWLKVGNKFTFSQNTRHILPENSEKSSVVASAMRMDPLTPIYLSGEPALDADILGRLTVGENDQYYGISENLRDNGYFNIANPLARIVNSHTSYLENKIHGKVYGQAEITGDLLFTSSLNVDATYRYWKNWEPNFYYSSFNNLATSYVEARMDNLFNFSWDNLLKYQKSFEDHHFLALAGYSLKLLKWRYTYGSRQGLQLMLDNYAHLSSTTIDTPDSKFIGGDYFDIKISSLYGMIDYNYKGKYLASLSLRSDAPTDSAGYEGSHMFYSGGLAWVVSEEEFWPLPLINSFKIRASMGTAGAHNPYNPLESEKIQKINAGFDMGLKDNLISISFDYFDHTSSDLNIYTIVDTIAGWYDVGEVKNSGMEFSVGLNNNKGDFKYSVALVATYLKNEVTELNSDLGVIYGTQVSDTNVVTMISEGYPIWHFCGYETNGVFQNQGEIDSYVNGSGQLLQSGAIPGDLRFVDTNGDGVIDMDDMVDIGKPYPDWIYGLNINLGYKGIDLGISLQGARGFEIYNAIKGSNVNFSNRYVSFYEDRWTQANHTNDWFRPLASDRNVNTRPSALYIEDGSYIKLRQVTLGYTLPEDLTKKVHVESLRLFVSLNNILTISDYSGLDPEVGYSSYLPGSLGVDRGIYPLASSMLFGINLGL
jgi:TonB-dependent SusC/RagA subfamily outer membrane receptor